jgi:predicted Ser/Thr protein kinase
MTCPHCGAENDHANLSCGVCGQPLGVLAPGQVLAGRFEILNRIGAGGMGVVYKAHDRELDEVVALKVLRSDLAHSEEMARRFRSEIKLARRVRDPHVCGIHEYGQDGPLRFIVMEFVEGVDLKRVLSKGPLPDDKAFEVAIQVAGALAAIHDAGILHRDLKPANVMLDSAGRVHLMDFGIAKQFGQSASSTGLTAVGQIIGTPEYMSPEQIRGESLDARSDIYALGVMLFELFTGRVPFRGQTALGTLYEHVHSPVPVHAAREAGVAPAVIGVLERVLAKSTDERYATASDVREALREARGAPRPAVGQEVGELRDGMTELIDGTLALDLELQPSTGPESSAPTVSAGVATAVARPAAAAAAEPATPRRAYGGRPPRQRDASAVAPRAGQRRVSATIALAAVLCGVALAWRFAPQLRETLGLAVTPPQPGVVPANLPVRPAVPSMAPAGVAPATALPAPVPGTLEPSAAPSAAPAAPSAAPTRAAPTSPPPSAHATEAPPPGPQPRGASIDHADELFASGRFAAAMAEARAVLAREPENQEARQLVEDVEVELLVERKLKEARDALASGNRELALQCVQAGLAAKPTDSRLTALRRELGPQ